MKLLSRKEFIGDMPRQYRETIRGIRKAIFREKMLLAQGLRDRSISDSEANEIRQKIYILLDMEQDMCRAKKTVENYYEPGGGYDDAYCILGRIAGGCHYRSGSPVERLVARGIRGSRRYQ